MGGIAALSWEMVWQLRSSLAFGVSALGTALTLAATMGGMTAGSLAMGRILRNRTPAKPLRLYACLELLIGLSGLFMLSGFDLLEILDARAYAFSPAVAPLLHILGIALLLALPTSSMGATIPVFQLIARSYRVPVSVIYGINTAGAAFGVMFLSFVLLPWLGAWRACQFIAALNLLVFTGAFCMRKGSSPDRAEAMARTEGTTAPQSGMQNFAAALLVVFVTGYVTFALEVTWFRSLRAAFWSTTGTFAIMLASVLIPLAVGASLVPWIRRRNVSPGLLLACAGIAVLLATPLVERMDLFAVMPGNYYLVLGIWLMYSLAFLGPAFLFLSTALPWCLEQFPLPEKSGRLYAVNTLGAVMGSLSAAWILLPRLGSSRSAWLTGICVILVSLCISRQSVRWFALAAGGVSLFAAVVLTSSPGRDRFQHASDFAGHQIIAFVEGPDATTSVVQRPDGSRVLMIDGFSAAIQIPNETIYMHWMGSLPMLLHPHPEQALVICFGSGQTANGLRQEKPVHLDVVDINREVFKMAPYFPSNSGVLDDPRVSMHVMDGRAWLRRVHHHYDVVTLEPMPPNFVGMNSLYSKEFYEIVSQRLRPGGILAQWLPFHLVNPHHAASIAATFRAVFTDAILWQDKPRSPGILLGRLPGSSNRLGETWPGLDRREMERALTDDQIRQAILLDADALASYAEEGTIITDDNQLLSFSQIRSGLQGTRGRWMNMQNNIIIRKYAAKSREGRR